MIANASVDETYAVASLPRPGESMIGRFVARDLGGKGANVAVVLARAGVATTLVAVVGDDDRGAFVRARLAAEPLKTLLVPAAACPTDLSLIYATPDGDNAIVTTVAAAQTLQPEQASAVMDCLRAGDIVVLQGNLGRDVTLALIEAARSRQLVVALNPSPLSQWLQDAVRRVQIVFANEAEADALTGECGNAAVRALLSCGPEQVIVTRGAAGAVLGTRCGSSGDHVGISLVTAPAEKTEVVDTTGAGDTFMAVALASAVRRHVSIDETALAQATRASAITVGRRGTVSAFPRGHELDALW